MSFNAAAALEHLNLGGTKTAVIIGGTTGMGAAIARLLGRLGVGHLVVFGRNEERGRQVLAEAEQLSPEGSEIRVDFVRGDLR
jgi:NAD(P)-dependent dehydrogenase (short-subunit alcohol dehydrogenase family)